MILQKGYRTGLDVGCGSNSILKPLRQYNFHSTGIDINTEAIKNSEVHDVHNEYICDNFKNIGINKQYDVVVLSHVIEHFTRDEAHELLVKAESIARHLVYIETPYGFLEQTERDGNVNQRHLSGWFPHDFEGRGYSVFGSGVRCLRGSEGRARYLPEAGVRTIDRMMQRFYFRRPHLARTISAIRFTDNDGNIRHV